MTEPTYEQLEAKIRRLEKEKSNRQRLEKELDLYLQGIAHDIGNSLTVVKGLVDLALASTNSETEIYDHLVQARKCCDNICSLTQQLTNISKAVAPEKKPEYIFSLLLETTELALSNSSSQLAYNLASELPQIMIDAEQISQVIQNLVINADQAMPGGTIYVSACQVDIKDDIIMMPGKYIKINVEDEGAGIPDEHQTKIFNIDFTTKPTGQGLGLAISKLIVENHNGYISFESQHGKTIFSVYLPVEE